MRYLALLMLGLMLAGCPDGDPMTDAGLRPDGGSDAGVAGKLERPGLPRPPQGGLPSDLRPPE
jgi:hypothetical protein